MFSPELLEHFTICTCPRLVYDFFVEIRFVYTFCTGPCFKSIHPCYSRAERKKKTGFPSQSSSIHYYLMNPLPLDAILKPRPNRQTGTSRSCTKKPIMRLYSSKCHEKISKKSFSITAWHCGCTIISVTLTFGI